MHLLATRPAEDSARLARLLEARGHRVTIEPMLTIEPVAFALPSDPFAAFVITSRHGARALASQYPVARFADVPAYCVGPATAEAAREAGLRHVIAGDGEASALAAKIAAMVPSGSGELVHLRGHHSRAGLAEVLGDAGITVRETTSYVARACQGLTPSTRAILAEREVEGVLLFSARTTQTFCELVEEAGVAAGLAGRTAFCLSAAIADAVTIAGMRTELAGAPTLQAMVELVGETGPRAP